MTLRHTSPVTQWPVSYGTACTVAGPALTDRQASLAFSYGRAHRTALVFLGDTLTAYWAVGLAWSSIASHTEPTACQR